LWQLDRQSVRWIQLSEPRHVTQIVPPPRKPALSPEESQVLV
jgi:hypothetical protein